MNFDCELYMICRDAPAVLYTESPQRKTFSSLENTHALWGILGHGSVRTEVCVHVCVNAACTLCDNRH